MGVNAACVYYIHACMCTCVLPFPSMCKLEIDFDSLPLWLFKLNVDIRLSSTEPGICVFG